MLKKIREYYHRASLKGKLSVTTFGSIISVVGKNTVEIMEPF
ncbi:hypothetical protein ABID28_001246 [Streptococcus porcorum]|uniref:Uncharacterized protein n=1 Tax=Streptococcus porcorum TaxID=701526 RepID=A0ABV2JGB1_9STRE